MEATSAPPILLPGIDHLPCLQEIRNVKVLLPFCKQNASLQQLLSHMATVRSKLDQINNARSKGDGNDNDNGDSHSSGNDYWS